MNSLQSIATILSVKNLQGANLQGANLRDADLRGANLRDTNLQGADLQRAHLCDADLRSANLQRAHLCDADLRSADLQGANLQRAHLCDANLQSANLCGANLRDANLINANLQGADLQGANLRDADLQDADLRSANLRGANLSEATGLTSSYEWALKNLKKNDIGWIVYKAFGTTLYKQPWTPEKGLVIEEVVNQLPTSTCACGVNVATLEWVMREAYSGVEIWEALIPFERSCGMVIPYNTDGKIRTDYLICLKKVR